MVRARTEPPRLGIALFGAGLMGAFHARTLASTSFATLLHVIDADAALAARVAEAVGAPASGADVAAALDDDAVGAVVIATPAGTHGGLVEAAARAGKAIFCEKPLGLSLEEAARVAQTVRAARVPFQIGFQRRYDPGIARLLATLANGELGTLETFRSVTCDPHAPGLEAMRRAAGIFHDTLAHDADLALAVGGPITSVTALGACATDPRFEAIGKPDTTVITLRFASGALGVIENRLRTGYGYETVVEVGGSTGKGVVRADELDRLTLFRDGRIERAHVPWFLERFAEAYRAELGVFVQAVRAQRQPEPGLEQGLAVMRVCAAAERSYLEGAPVEPAAGATGALAAPDAAPRLTP